MKTGPKPVDLSGRKFNRLLVLRPVDETLRFFVCRCDCGKETIGRKASIKSGHKRSCGCALRNRPPPPNKTHGLRETVEFDAWVKLRQRCENPRNAKYANYGGRGIIVCDRWQSFANFYADLGPRPGRGYSVDRIDNDGPYAPDNCRWATAKTQANNRRPWRRLTLQCAGCGGDFHPIRQDAKFCGGTCAMRAQRARRKAIM